MTKEIGSRLVLLTKQLGLMYYQVRSIDLKPKLEQTLMSPHLAKIQPTVLGPVQCFRDLDNRACEWLRHIVCATPGCTHRITTAVFPAQSPKNRSQAPGLNIEDLSV